MKINWMKLRPLYLLISGLVIGMGIYSIVSWGFVVGIDFKGGTIVEYKFEKQVSTENITSKLNSEGYDVNTIQQTSDGTYLLKLAAVEQDKRQDLVDKLKQATEGEVTELRYETVGPSIGPELIKKTIYALLLAAVSILAWIAYQFKSVRFGVSAVLAMLHDTLVVLGVFSLLGHLYGAEVDFLFVTALLTVLAFSVHDTIIVFDRIRELKRKHGGGIYELANLAVNQTMRRSLANSLTVIFMLVALVVLGGTTIHWFAMALLIGTVSGAYSSPFVAVPVLVTWDEVAKKNLGEKIRKRAPKVKIKLPKRKK